MSLALEVPPRGAPVPTLTPEQAAVVERAATGTGHLVVVGVPGSGKTTVALAIAARAVAHGMDPARLLLLAPTRQAAARLRDRVAAAVERPAAVPEPAPAAEVPEPTPEAPQALPERVERAALPRTGGDGRWVPVAVLLGVGAALTGVAGRRLRSRSA